MRTKNRIVQQSDFVGSSGFINPEDRLWNLYLSEAEKEDKVLTENIKGDTDGILIFVRIAS
jgi:hypothetical protein